MVSDLVVDLQLFRRLSAGAPKGDKLVCLRTSQASMSDLRHRNTRLVRSATLISMEKDISLSNRLHSELRILISIADESSDGFITDLQTLQKYLVIFEFEK
jgi:hypothetical protein